MKATRTNLEGLLVLEPQLHADERGVLFESFNERRFAELTGDKCTFVQDNHTISRSGVLRGLHYQVPPRAQGKLIRVLRGAIFDVAVDIRPESPTFGRWAGMLLSAENHRQFWIPAGFAHGFLALTDCEVLYKMDAYYAPDLQRSIRWDDPAIGICWPLSGKPILSPADEAAGTLDQFAAFASAAGATHGLARLQSFD